MYDRDKQSGIMKLICACRVAACAVAKDIDRFIAQMINDSEG